MCRWNSTSAQTRLGHTDARHAGEWQTRTYLGARVRLPDVPPNKVKIDTFGGFVVGPGRYHVEWAMFDDQSRVCRKEWNIEAKLKHGERNVKLDIPPATVGDFGGKGLPPPRARATTRRLSASPFCCMPRPPAHGARVCASTTAFC